MAKTKTKSNKPPKATNKEQQYKKHEVSNNNNQHAINKQLATNNTQQEGETNKGNGKAGKAPRWLEEMSKKIRPRSSEVLAGPLQVLKKRHAEEYRQVQEKIDAVRRALGKRNKRDSEQIHRVREAKLNAYHLRRELFLRHRKEIEELKLSQIASKDPQAQKATLRIGVKPRLTKAEKSMQAKRDKLRELEEISDDEGEGFGDDDDESNAEDGEFSDDDGGDGDMSDKGESDSESESKSDSESEAESEAEKPAKRLKVAHSSHNKTAASNGSDKTNRGANDTRASSADEDSSDNESSADESSSDSESSDGGANDNSSSENEDSGDKKYNQTKKETILQTKGNLVRKNAR